MLNFKEPELSDRQWIDSLIAGQHRNADLSFTNIYLWKDGLKTLIARVGDRLIMKSGLVYTYPVGRGDLKAAVDAMKADSAESGCSLFMRGIPAAGIEHLRELYPGEFELYPDADSSDYVYLASALADPTGKKLHSKKNHINRFIAENDWSYEPISRNNLADCEKFTAEWMILYGEKLFSVGLDERAALKRMFADYFVLGLEGGILRANGKVVAFTVGEVLTADTFVTHFEKAYANVNGAYPMINREFARQIIRNHPEIIYINREEDMGIETLRRAKQSYYPEFMVDKYIAEWR